MFEKRKKLTKLGIRVGTLGRPEPFGNWDWEFGVGAVNFSSSFSLYLRWAAVPLQSGCLPGVHLIKL